MKDKIIKAALSGTKAFSKLPKSITLSDKHTLFSLEYTEIELKKLVEHVHKSPIEWEKTNCSDFPFKTNIVVGNKDIDIVLKLGDFPDEALYKSVLETDKSVILSESNGFLSNWQKIGITPKI